MSRRSEQRGDYQETAASGHLGPGVGMVTSPVPGLTTPGAGFPGHPFPATPGREHRALRVLGLTVYVIGLLALTAGACLLSYSGLHVLALQAGVSSKLARGYPLMLDGAAVLAGFAVVVLRGAGWFSRVIAWLSLLVLLAALMAGAALHAAGFTLLRRPAALTAAIVPWVLVLIAFSLLTVLLRYVMVRHQNGVAAKRGRRQPIHPIQPTSLAIQVTQSGPAAAAPVAPGPVAPGPVAPAAIAPAAVAPVAPAAIATAAAAGPARPGTEPVTVPGHQTPASAIAAPADAREATGSPAESPAVAAGLPEPRPDQAETGSPAKPERRPVTKPLPLRRPFRARHAAPADQAWQFKAQVPVQQSAPSPAFDTSEQGAGPAAAAPPPAGAGDPAAVTGDFTGPGPGETETVQKRKTSGTKLPRRIPGAHARPGKPDGGKRAGTGPAVTGEAVTGEAAQQPDPASGGTAPGQPGRSDADGRAEPSQGESSRPPDFRRSRSSPAPPTE